MDRCPACGSFRIYPSRLRNFGERLRHLVTGRQPYRCHQCDWRRWSRVTFLTQSSAPTSPDELRLPGSHGPVARPDLDRLDVK